MVHSTATYRKRASPSALYANIKNIAGLYFSSGYGELIPPLSGKLTPLLSDHFSASATGFRKEVTPLISTPGG